MKKLFIFLFCLVLSVGAFCQKTVAVYVTSSESVSPETKRILGSELVSAITRTNEYVAIERTDEFMAQVSQERGNYEIDDAKLFDLGKKFGASNVCVADVTKFGEEYYIVARLLDIRTSKVWRTSRKYSKLNSLKELVETSESLAEGLFGQTKEFSTYANGDNKDNLTLITKIENRETYTKVTFKIVTISPSQQIGISSETYIEDVATSIRYPLKNASNINIIDKKNSNYKTINKGITEYSLFFELLPEDASNIMIIEPGGYEYKDIILKPYGNENTFVFEDKSQQLYNERSGVTPNINNRANASSNTSSDIYEYASGNIYTNNATNGKSHYVEEVKKESKDMAYETDNTALEQTIVRWDVQSRPQGADIFWRVVSKAPDVKSTNNNYLMTTPYEATRALDIKGLTNQNASNVRIILRCEKDGYLSQEKEFNVRMVMDQEEISAFFRLVKEE
ncbi:MAG: hypothetical protein IKS65_10560 [Bacteroidales bacterium]|nr:hypothetical protein [Bacteroidales bacterium]